jgi:hypothetical protein
VGWSVELLAVEKKEREGKRKKEKKKPWRRVLAIGGLVR